MIYNIEEVEDITELLKNLSFAFNKSPQLNKISFLLGEFAKLEFTSDMIKRGIDSCMNNLDYEPTFKQLKNSILRFAPKKTLEGCQKCNQSGLVTLERDGNDYAFACDCVKGKSMAFEGKTHRIRIFTKGLNDGFLSKIIPSDFVISIQKIKGMYEKFLGGLRA